MPKIPISPISLRPPFLTFNGAWHLVYYIPSRNRSESLSKSLVEFKSNNKATVVRWTQHAIPIINSLGIKFDVVVRALGSTETSACGTKPLDYFGSQLEKKYGFKYVPELIKKTRETNPLHTYRTKWQRQEELEGVYYLDDTVELEGSRHILILDDISTTGSTTKSILAAIKEVYPDSNVYFFTLGRTGGRDDDGEYITTLNSNFDCTFLTS